MISGTKISQLPVITVLQDTDYLPIARGATTNRISGLTLNQATLSTVKANYPIDYSSGIFTLSSNNTISLQSGNIKAQTNLFSLTGSQVIETNSLSAALRITQTGAGNALVVEDAANPDSTPFVVTSSGNIGIGSLAPANKLHVHNSPSTTATNAHIKLSQTTNSNESYIATDSAGYIRVGGTAGVGLVVLSAGEVVSVLSGGNVGIGTIAPNEKLTVSGNISANTVYAYISGNSETATKWQTARNIALSGSILGNTTIDGAQNTTIFTTISTGVIVDTNIADSANISDTKLAPIVSQGKVSPTAIDYTGSLPNQVLTSTGSATIWQNLSSIQTPILSGTITTDLLNDEAVTTIKLVDNAVTSVKLSAGSVSTSKIADSAITTSKILDGSVTLQKLVSFAAAVPNSVVSRDLSGNLSAVEVTADLKGNVKGNADTATALQTPMTLVVGGVVTGQVNFDGSQTAVLNVTNTVGTQVQPWVSFVGTPSYDLTATYVQGTNATPSNFITLTLQNTATNIQQNTYNFQQQNNTVTIYLTSIPPENNTATFLTYNLLTGTSLTAVFTNEQAITGSYTPLPSGTYTIQNVTQNVSSVVVSISTNLTQYTTGNANISYNYLYFNEPFNVQEGHTLQIILTSCDALSGGAITPAVSGGIYTITEPGSSYSVVLSTNFSQSASGVIIMPYSQILNSFGISNVVHVDKGNYILNFQSPFIDDGYGHSGSIRHNPIIDDENPELSGFYIPLIQTYTDTIKDTQNLQLLTYVDNRKEYFQQHNFDFVHILCFGQQGS